MFFFLNYNLKLSSLILLFPNFQLKTNILLSEYKFRPSPFAMFPDFVIK